MKVSRLVFSLIIITSGCISQSSFDVVIRHGRICDGTGSPSYTADVGINSDTIAFIGDLGKARGMNEIDATNLVVAPGFINMLSWANESLIEDGRSQSDLRQGVTLEVLGEGE
ncbi:MAG: D-aminoacylase, partial [Bacteroidales bacterium]|nr:D-aminoacylase [Bacteroidales bacterium]